MTTTTVDPEERVRAADRRYRAVTTPLFDALLAGRAGNDEAVRASLRLAIEAAVQWSTATEVRR